MSEPTAKKPSEWPERVAWLSLGAVFGGVVAALIVHALKGDAESQLLEYLLQQGPTVVLSVLCLWTVWKKAERKDAENLEVHREKAKIQDERLRDQDSTLDRERESMHLQIDAMNSCSREIKDLGALLGGQGETIGKGVEAARDGVVELLRRVPE